MLRVISYLLLIKYSQTSYRGFSFRLGVLEEYSLYERLYEYKYKYCNMEMFEFSSNS